MYECIITSYGKSWNNINFNFKQNLLGYILIRFFEIVIKTTLKNEYKFIENINEIDSLISFS